MRVRVHISLSLHYSELILPPQVANGGGPIRKRGRGFQSSAGLYPCPVQCFTLDSDVGICPLVGNEGGVVSEQTYDRVESTQVRDSDIRAARCEYCCASFVYVSRCDACPPRSGRRMDRSRNQCPRGGNRGRCYRKVRRLWGDQESTSQSRSEDRLCKSGFSDKFAPGE
jgi:hypothetical protein